MSVDVLHLQGVEAQVNSFTAKIHSVSEKIAMLAMQGEGTVTEGFQSGKHSDLSHV